MKKIFITLFVSLTFIFISWKYHEVKFDDPNKDKLLIELLKYVLEKGHYQSQDINDQLSIKVFNSYLEMIDPQKKYFLNSDFKEFKKYEKLIDDQWLSYDLTFFNLTHDRLVQRINEVELFLPSLFKKTFEFDSDEKINVDFENLSFPKNDNERKERWRKQLKFSMLDLYDIKILDQKKLIESNSDYVKKSNSDLLNESLEIVNDNINDIFDLMNDLERKDWFSNYVNSFVTQYDPHTVYFKPEDKDRFDVNISGRFDGIGARLQKRDGGIEIVQIILGGPLWKDKKIEAGDEIIKVGEPGKDPVNVIGMRIDDAIKLIKGPKGTVVELTVRRKVDNEIKTFPITRDEVVLEESYAKSTLIKKDNKTYGLITLPKFYVDFNDYKEINCASDVKKEIINLKKEGIEGLVLDLRNNGGGALQTVVDMTGLFIETGPIVQVKSIGNRKKVLYDKDPSVFWDGPLVILVNQMSASASEIMAAALQDYERAVVIGSDNTFGKGTVQNVLDLNRFLSNSDFDLGALKITTEKFYRINGGSVQLKGVESDIVTPNTYSHIEIGEADEKNPLKWDQIDKAQFRKWDGYYNLESVINDSKLRISKNELFSLIDQNAKWFSERRKNKSYSLNYNTFKNDQKNNKLKLKKFDRIKDYNNNLNFNLLSDQSSKIKDTEEYKENRKRWHNSLKSDIYINESINVLLNLKTKKIENNNILAKVG
ncbi:carboxy terminal-processing peptidase [Flavobacteriaceae bacterium]|jgi:carboxyl-terminal processing protease|nr:carboxy terminal-processing peptidase [Flavobacteriaceae bacterium]MBT7573891.1 carboxy terminal-processing peptidase [Flavobacteriaceae bacterium]MDA7566739.1 carboxy terminal-processing peptidase [Flavobacteriaceae bacterium]MDB4601202.1 carboxy terminal-processing peptidase [Flavobacteriaceae bacterium]MDC0924160.1 carboxy terminal-processing peptidase [Flavobacteriaceae bacterium]